MSETFIVTFNDLASYEKYKADVIANGGTIKNDLGTTLLGFTAVMPLTLVRTIRSGNFAERGITSFEPDSEVRIQPKA